MSETGGISAETWLALQNRAKVFKQGSHWVYEHVCWGRGGVPVNSYPMNTQQVAFIAARNHVKWCIG